MQNIIRNTSLASGKSGGPEYFSGRGFSYDRLLFNDCRTCSVTLSPSSFQTAHFTYDPVINVSKTSLLKWGITIRALEAQSVFLTAKFYNKNNDYLCCLRQPIHNGLTLAFTQRTAVFSVPRGAEYAHLSAEFTGRITACTFCRPSCKIN